MKLQDRWEVCDHVGKVLFVCWSNRVELKQVVKDCFCLEMKYRIEMDYGKVLVVFVGASVDSGVRRMQCNFFKGKKENGENLWWLGDNWEFSRKWWVSRWLF
ncbi:ferredoxin-1 [Striga asiatica]|uniref:Ferredoxin-1 n=1 Tax=Striga asiatica TaxID=4170 RepID=A0A5A7PG33_STRAF|nr:ferredoxin-1 [Striga asiatica]